MNIYYLNLVTYFGFYHDFTIPKGIEKLKSLIKDQNNKIILSVLWEVWPHDKIMSALEALEVFPNQDNVVLILDSYSYHDPDQWKNANIILYDSWMCGTYKTENPTLTNQLEHDKLLFILGKPHKKQRILALYELYRQNKLDKCDWSMHYDPHLEGITRCHLPVIPDDDYQKFIASTIRKLDDVTPKFGNNTTDFYHVCFKPTSHFYEQTSISLVTETTFNPNFQFITEKTWKAVNNFHPFVLLDYKKTYEYLHALGVDTFQYAVKHSYDKLVGLEEDVISMCVDNVLYLLENRSQYKDQLIASAINNKQIFEKLATTYSNNLHPYIEDIIWNGPVHKIKNDISIEVYDRLWSNTVSR